MPVLFRHRHLANAPQHQLLVDDQGNCKQVQIRGTEVVLGDDAQGTGVGSVAIGRGVVNPAADTVSFGAASSVFIHGTSSGVFARNVENNVSTGATLTAAQMGPLAIVDVSAGGAGNLTSTTGALLDAAFPGLTTGMGWLFYVNNNAGGAVTLLGNTGVTLDADVPSTTAIQNADGVAVAVRRTGTATYTMRIVARQTSGGGGMGAVIVAGAGTNSMEYLTGNASGNESISIGHNSTASAQDSIAYGTTAASSGAGAISIGRQTDTQAAACIAIGWRAFCSGIEGIAIGGDSAGGLGLGAACTGARGVSIGTDSIVSADDGIALGPGAETTSASAIAIGSLATALALNCIALGVSAKAETNTSGIAIGNTAYCSGLNGVSIGSGAQVSASSAVSIGAGVLNSIANTVNLGSNSTVYTKIHSSGQVQDAGYAVNNASFVSTADTAPTLNSALPFHPGVILVGAPTVGRAYTLDTGANYDTQFPHFANNDSFLFRIVNNGVATITLTAAAGSTISGTATVAADFSRIYQMQKTGAATWVATSLDVISHLAGSGSGVIVAGAGTNSAEYLTGNAAGNESISIGHNSTAPSLNSIAIGTSADGTGAGSIAIGNASATANDGSIAIGDGATTGGGSNAIAIGTGANSSNISAVCLGPSSSATSTECIALGSAVNVTAPNCAAIGDSITNNVASSLLVGFNSAVMFAVAGNATISHQPVANTPNYQDYSTATMAGARTLTETDISPSAHLVGTDLFDTSGMGMGPFAETWTTETAANLVAFFEHCQVGDAWYFDIQNDFPDPMSLAATTITLAGGAGVTVTGTATILNTEPLMATSPPDASYVRRFRLEFTNVGAMTEAVTILSLYSTPVF